MKKITMLLLLLFALAAISMLFAGCGGEQQESRVLRLACTESDGHPSVTGALAMASYVERRTNGALKIEVLNNAVLGDEFSTIGQTVSGEIDFIRTGLSILSDINPMMNSLAIPFIFRDREHKFRVLDGPIGQEFLESMTRRNLLGLAWLDSGFRSLYNSRQTVRTPADLNGLRIRVPGTALMIDTIRLMGGQPTLFPYGEIYQGLRDNIIEGAENNWRSYVGNAHYQAARFITVTNHIALPEMFLINARVWASLSPAQQRIVRRGAEEGARVQRAEWLLAEERYEIQARASGNVITNLTLAERQLFIDALLPLHSHISYYQFAPIVRRVRETR